MAQTICSAAIHYPESDGQPMANNTEQLRWIVVLFDNLAALFRDDPTVFVGADLLWYPVEGRPDVRVAPDVLVAFGRPKGPRGSYRQWDEGGVPLTVVFEVLSPGNSPFEMIDKHTFYEEHGVEEYYVYDPDTNHLAVLVRRGEVLRRAHPADGFVSPRLGIRFDLSGPELTVYRPDGRPFIAFEDLQADRERDLQRAAEAERRADEERRRADEERARAERERQRAEQAEAELARLRRLLDERP